MSVSLVAGHALANELVVNVTGVEAPLGQIGCSLYASDSGFPMDTTQATVTRASAQPGGITCRFTGLNPGRYAVAVSHDANGNGKVDANLLGIPTEQWGVSNNVRPRLRAPRFDEAAFEVTGLASPHVLDIRIAR